MNNNVIQKRENIIFSIITIFMSVLLTLLITEVVLRLFAPDWLELRMKELTAGQAYEFGSDQNWPEVKVAGKFKNFKPNSSFTVRNLEYDNKANIDEFGGRNTKHKEHGNIVPFLGDSFTFGVGVEDQETYVNLLSGKARVRLLNLGVPGSALHNQNDIVAMRHNEIGKPRLYVFNIFIGNDFADIYEHHLSTSTQNGMQKMTDKQTASWISSFNDFVFQNDILKRLYTIQFIRKQILVFINRNSSELMNPIFKIAGKDELYLSHANSFLKKELERLKDMSTTLNFNVVFVLLPDVFQVNKPLMRIKAKYYGIEEDMLDMLAPNRVLEEDFKSYQIQFLDTTGCLMKNKRIDMLYYIQDNHFTKYGHEAVAECLEQQGIYSIFNALSQ